MRGWIAPTKILHARDKNTRGYEREIARDIADTRGEGQEARREVEPGKGNNKCRDCRTKRQGFWVEYLNGSTNSATKLQFNFGQGMLIRKRLANCPDTKKKMTQSVFHARECGNACKGRFLCFDVVRKCPKY